MCIGMMTTSNSFFAAIVGGVASQRVASPLVRGLGCSARNCPNSYRGRPRNARAAASFWSRWLGCPFEHVLLTALPEYGHIGDGRLVGQSVDVDLQAPIPYFAPILLKLHVHIPVQGLHVLGCCHPLPEKAKSVQLRVCRFQQIMRTVASHSASDPSGRRAESGTGWGISPQSRRYLPPWWHLPSSRTPITSFRMKSAKASWMTF